MYELLAVNLLECSVGIPEPLSEELCEVRTCSFFHFLPSNDTLMSCDCVVYSE